MTNLTARERVEQLNSSAWSVLQQLTDTYNGGGSFRYVAKRADELLTKREQIRWEILMRAGQGQEEV